MRQRGSGRPGPGARERVLRRLLAVVPAVALAAVGVWLAPLERVSLLGATAAALVEVAGVAGLAVAWLRREPRWWQRVMPTLLASAGAVTAAVVVTLRLTGVVTDPYPPQLVLWAGLGCAALLTALSTVRRPGRLRRAAAVAAVPLTLTGAFLLINQEYALWPRFGDLIGDHPAPTAEAAMSQLARLTLAADRAGAGRTGHGGRYVALDVPPVQSRFAHQPGGVYLPPAYFTPARAHLPVLVMLGGTPGSPAQWVVIGRAVKVADAYAASHGGAAPILIFVDENGSTTSDTECVDRPRARAETFLTVDVPAFVTGILGVTAHPQRWAVAGFSEGGTCAVNLVLGHEDIYRHIGDISGDERPTLGNHRHTRNRLFLGSAAEERRHDPVALLAGQHPPGMSAWFIAGDRDHRRIEVAHLLTGLANRAGVVAHELILPGRHDWRFARDAFARLLPELADELLATEIPATAVATAGTSTAGTSTASPSGVATGGHP